MKYFRSKNYLFRLFAVLLFICASCLGFVAGDVFFSKNSTIPEWRYLGSPPEKIERLLVADFDTIYVGTIDKNIYSCRWSSPYDVNCWFRVEEIPEIFEPNCRYPQSTPPSLPFDNSVEILRFHHCSTFAGSDSDAAFSYYLLCDGTVVQWGYDSFHIGWPAGVIKEWVKYVMTGFVLGICLSISFIIVAYFVNPSCHLESLERSSDDKKSDLELKASSSDCVDVLR